MNTKGKGNLFVVQKRHRQGYVEEIEGVQYSAGEFHVGEPAPKKPARKQPSCQSCGQPRKGHTRGICNDEVADS